MAKAQLLARTATKEAAVKAYAAADELPKTTSGQKLDIELNLIRIGMHTPRPGLGSSPRCPPSCGAARAQLTPARPAGMFWSDIPLVDAHVKTAQILVDKGGDWERRNRLKVYRDETAPLLDYYAGQLVTVDAIGEVEEVNARALEAIEDHGK